MLFASLIQNWKLIALVILVTAILVYRAVLVHQRDTARAQVAALTDAAAVLRAANASMAAAVTQQNQAVAALQAKMKLAQDAAAVRETQSANRASQALAQELASTIKQLPTSYGALRIAAGKIFALKSDPAREQPELVVFASLTNHVPEKVVMDPLQLDAQGHVEIDFFEPSHDGRYVAISLSRLSSEAGDLHVFEVDSGKELKSDVIPRVNNGTAGGSVAWNADGTGFFYTRYPRSGERASEDLNFYQQIYFHNLGDPEAKDR